ncbi:hypothetical protein [Arthrobacter cryoconiti]|uniref:Transposase n=1 Tax=Arthrobacter cryoconiti TaxID=748907 RepID=A0ABV8R298_9MICC|nr:hypothetical protein [Arthrobacter cryoconiti]MCC9068050.1 hypothetical protein [Arthrobacter cryoconiti]
MARHAQLTLATDVQVYFAHPLSPWERPSIENTNCLIRELLSKGHRAHRSSTLSGLQRRRAQQPARAVLGLLMPREVFTKLLNANGAKTA